MMQNLVGNVEYTEPAKAFRAAGHEVATVGPEKGDRITGFTGAARAFVHRSEPRAFRRAAHPGRLLPGGARGYDHAIDLVKSTRDSA
jgi:protease I